MVHCIAFMNMFGYMVRCKTQPVGNDMDDGQSERDRGGGEYVFCFCLCEI